MTDPASDQTVPLDRQIADLRELAGRIHTSLKDADRLPSTVRSRLGQLLLRVNEIAEQVARLEGQRQDHLALAEISQVVNSSLELNEVLRIVMDTIVRLTGAERGFLMLRDERGELSIRIARNWEQESIVPTEFALSRTVVNRVATEGRPVLTTNAQEDPRFGRQDSVVAYNLRSILCVPLTNKGEVTGVIYADNRVRTGIFTETERDLLNAFANQAAVAIENARLFESVRQTLAEVTELKNLMDNVFASIASGVITADVEDKITLCNQASEAILGRSTREMLGQTLDEILPPLSETLSRHLQTVRQTDRPVVGLEVTSTLPRRGPVDLRFNLSPLKDASQITQGVAIVVDDLTEQKRLEALHNLFERMVSPAIIEQLDPNQLQLGGERIQITTLFADIRGFTRFSETVDPEQLVTVLNRYLGAATDAVLKEEGTLDKFLGDAIMAFFNAPIAQPDHTLRAVRAALGMKAAVRELHRSLPYDFRLYFGSGIHFGEVLLGIVGTEQRMDYTAIGDSVNTARRLQENAAPDQILISARAYEHVRAWVDARPVAPVQAKGKLRPVQVYEVVGLRS